MRREDFGIGTLFDKVRDAVIVAEAGSGRVLFWNLAATKVFGYPPSEARGMLVETLVPEHLKECHRAGLARYAQTGQGPYVESEEYLELPAVRKDGEGIVVELSLNRIGAVGDADGAGRFVLAIVRDVTERKRTEERLRGAEARYRTLIEQIPAVTYTQETTGPESIESKPTMYASPQIEAQTGYPPQAFAEDPGLWVRLLHPDDRERVMAEDERTDRTGEPFRVEYRQLTRGGRVVWVRDEAVLVRDEEGRPSVWQGVQFDITERKRAEEEIRRLNGELEERVAERTARLAERESQLKTLVGKLVVAQEEERRSVAYEIHDGLTQVAIAAHQHLQIFAENHPPGSRVGPGELDRALSLAQRVVREARHVIEGLRPTALDDFGLAAALRLMVEELREEGWKAAYEENLGAKRLNAEAETGLYRVAQEALSNARKHSGTSKVRLKLELEKRKVRLEVEDRGRGFDPRAVKRDGRPGERVGLAGMRERIALLGGELTIASTPGNGTCVAAEVPLEDSRKD
jgi:PAS domain S-box-containing protein